MIVLDTCALYWWTLKPEELSPEASRRCREIPVRGAQVCSVSLWELGLKAQRGQLDLGCPIREYARRLAQVKGVDIVPVDGDLWLSSLELDWAHRDPADRLIVALAARQRSTLLTRDTVIRDWYPRTLMA
jgi:PIN domain nuclease of toxin-antitoxin system